MKQLQLQDHVPLLALQTGLGEARHLPGGGGEMAVAPAATTALGDHEVLAGGHIHDDLLRLRIPDHGPPGDLDDQGFAPLAAHVAPRAVGTGSGGIFALIPEVQQRRQVVIDPQDHTAAMTAVAPIRTTGRHILLPMERHRPIAAPPTANGDAYFIYEHRKTSPNRMCHGVINYRLAAQPPPSPGGKVPPKGAEGECGR